MHFRFAAEPRDRVSKCLTIRAHGASQSIICIEDSSKTKGQDSCIAEAFADNTSMLDNRLLR
jgi:hypothetical protein